MTSVCATWKTVDATHFNGFCTNRFRLATPVDDVHVENSCDICITPGIPATDVCNPCLDVPWTFSTTSMTLLKRSWPTSCFSGCGPYPTTDLKSDTDIIALDMWRVNRCFWQSPRLTVASGCGCIDGDASVALMYAVIQKSVTASSSGTVLVFKYDSWISSTFDGPTAFFGSGTVSTFASVGHRLTGFDTSGDRCYEGSHTLTHTTSGDDTGLEVTHGYWTETKLDGTFDSVGLSASFA